MEEEYYACIVNSQVYSTPVGLQVAVDFCNYKTQKAMENKEHCVAQVISKNNTIVYLSIVTAPNETQV